MSAPPTHQPADTSTGAAPRWALRASWRRRLRTRRGSATSGSIGRPAVRLRTFSGVVYLLQRGDDFSGGRRFSLSGQHLDRIVGLSRAEPTVVRSVAGHWAVDRRPMGRRTDDSPMSAEHFARTVGSGSLGPTIVGSVAELWVGNRRRSWRLPDDTLGSARHSGRFSGTEPGRRDRRRLSRARASDDTANARACPSFPCQKENRHAPP